MPNKIESKSFLITYDRSLKLKGPFGTINRNPLNNLFFDLIATVYRKTPVLVSGVGSFSIAIY